MKKIKLTKISLQYRLEEHTITNSRSSITNQNNTGSTYAYHLQKEVLLQLT